MVVRVVPSTCRTALLLSLASTTAVRAQAQDLTFIPGLIGADGNSGAGAGVCGPIQDTTCDIEQLESANDSQLHVILEELGQTAFFRTFAVDLDHRCPLASWNNNNNGGKHVQPAAGTTTQEKPAIVAAAKATMPQVPDNNHGHDDEEYQCAGGLPDLDFDAEPACGVAQEDDFMATTASSFLGTSSFSASPPTKEEPFALEPDIQEKVEHPPLNDNSYVNNYDIDNNDEDSFECDGGDMADEMDPDDEPLCELTEEDFVQPSPLRDFISSALQSISDLAGWESESQRETFSWSNPSDPVVLDDCDGTSPQNGGGLLPDNFWMDMCAEIKTGEGVKLVNLALNSERNTGYNGTHIWTAIYEENCIALVDGQENAPMCYEERVLYRLLSGLHTSTTLSIAKNYWPPSKRKKRENWEANPEYFMEKFEKHPEYIRNLHFSYVVLLRALQKSSPFLYSYEIHTGNIVEDEKASVLLRRLLDSTILRSCQDVFTAFDESLMFKEDEAVSSDEVASLQKNFKGVFHNISSVLDCVQCQQCKLHGKMAMLGYGAALKILFTKEPLDARSLERNEIVAFINTIAKFSESLKEVRMLTHLFWNKNQKESLSAIGSIEKSPKPGELTPDLVDTAVGLASSLANQGRISAERETELVELALARDVNLLVLVKHYGSDEEKFLKKIASLGEHHEEPPKQEPDAIIIGSGLAGLTASLNILDRGGSVVIIEKEHLLGGNSNKASSGINACCPQNSTYGDEIQSFKSDTIRSAGNAAQLHLIETLVDGSADAVSWLKDRVGVDLSLLAQLGGHAHKRTHRPSNGMAGAEIIYGMQKAVKEYEKTGNVKILVDTKVSRLLTNDTDGRVIGVEFETLGKSSSSESGQLKSANTVLATGGFAADRSKGSYLSQYRPELITMPATAGEFSTGDGVTLATSLGAGIIDMEKVQIHPTGWVDPADPSNRSKILAAELMRGVGGVLINSEGKRFCNELGTRAYVTDKMLSHDAHYAETGQWKQESDVQTFSLVLASSAGEDGRKHVSLYTHKGLLMRLEGIVALAEWLGQDVDTIQSTLIQYQSDAKEGEDEWGKTSFRGVPAVNLENETFYAGTVTPVLHYCMGGITIDTKGNVLDVNSTIISGLHAAGEVAGGVHGNNRLGGNSLLECTVYGMIVGKKIPINSRVQSIPSLAIRKEAEEAVKQLREVTLDELNQHDAEDDCWVAIHGKVYDLTEFAEEHPAGAASIVDLAGMDGTEAFSAVHNEQMLNDFDDEIIGTFSQ